MNISLRRFYNEVLGEPVPDPFLKLLGEMTAPAERGEAGRGASFPAGIPGQSAPESDTHNDRPGSASTRTGEDSSDA